MQAFRRDVVWAYRALRRTPAAALAAILVIALGTGANTAVLAIAYGILLRPLPTPEPSRIVVVSRQTKAGREVGTPLNEIEEWQRRVRSFSSMGAYTVVELSIRGLGEPRHAKTAVVTPSFFDVLRVAPRVGRAPSTSDPDDWMILASALANTAGGSGGSGAASALGKAATAGERGLQVSGVMPPEFALPADDVAAWLPAKPFGRIKLASGREVPRDFRLVARLKDGVTVAQARDDVQRAFDEGNTKPEDRHVALVKTLDEVLFGKVRPVLKALTVGAMLVLLVTCANVATLLVSRAVARHRDLAVRLSLGASPWHLARTALAESLLVAGAGSAAGIVIATACVRLFVAVAAGAVPRLAAIAVDLPVLAGTVFTALVVTVICGLAPAAHALRSDFVSASKGSRASASRAVRLTRHGLIVAQIAASVVLLAGAGLMARTVSGLLADGAGANPDRVLVARLVLADTPRFDVASRMPIITEVLRAIRAVPGVEHAALGTNIPPRGSDITFSVQITEKGKLEDHRVHLAAVSSSYFAAVGTKVLEGHAIGEMDELRDGPVIVLSESAARLLSPGVKRDAGASLVGLELPWPLPAGVGGGKRPLVVGIVEDAKYLGLDTPPSEGIYARWKDLPASVGHLVVRTSGDPMLVADTIRRTVRNVDPSLPITNVHTLREEYALSITDRRVRLMPAAGFGLLAVAVAMVGLGGLLVRAISERRRELAIRAVIGASPADAVRTIVCEGALLAVIGLAIGVAGAAAAAKSLESFLYGVKPLDPLTFVGVALFVSAAALATSFLAAWRAARIQPLELLQSE